MKLKEAVQHVLEANKRSIGFVDEDANMTETERRMALFGIEQAAYNFKSFFNQESISFHEEKVKRVYDSLKEQMEYYEAISPEVFHGELTGFRHALMLLEIWCSDEVLETGKEEVTV